LPAALYRVARVERRKGREESKHEHAAEMDMGCEWIAAEHMEHIVT
jgi:hypothetical protein